MFFELDYSQLDFPVFHDSAIWHLQQESGDRSVHDMSKKAKHLTWKISLGFTP